MGNGSATRKWLSRAGRRLRELREGRGLTQLQLAYILDVTPAAISLWETGQRCPDAEHVYRMERELGLPAETWLRRAA